MGVLEDVLWGKRTREPVHKVTRSGIRAQQGYKCKKCGSSLKRGGHIHHKNGNPSDNRPGNLELLCTRHHKEITKKIAGERAKKRKKSW